MRQENGGMTLVSMLRGGQITLSADGRRALKLSEGAYLDLQVTNGTATLRPVEIVDRAEANRQLDSILSRVRYIGPGPQSSEDELMDMVVEEIDLLRARSDHGPSSLARYQSALSSLFTAPGAPGPLRSRFEVRAE
jgi:hypothetical protein